MQDAFFATPASLVLRQASCMFRQWARVCARLASRLQRRAEHRGRQQRLAAEWRAAECLPMALLEDMGAPDWLAQAAEGEHARERAERESLRAIRG